VQPHPPLANWHQVQGELIESSSSSSSHGFKRLTKAEAGYAFALSQPLVSSRQITHVLALGRLFEINVI
jgi:hypothetical protein